jgi:hypothetical protein
MLRALIAATAITVCCLGNDYPANSQVLDDSYWQQRQIEQLRQEQYRMQRGQQHRDATQSTRNHWSNY